MHTSISSKLAFFSRSLISFATGLVLLLLPSYGQGQDCAPEWTVEILAENGTDSTPRAATGRGHGGNVWL